MAVRPAVRAAWEDRRHHRPGADRAGDGGCAPKPSGCGRWACAARRRRWRGWMRYLTGPEGLARLLAESDFVVVAAALTGETRALIGAEQLARMKPTAWLINIARGGLVDEPALVAALQAGQIARRVSGRVCPGAAAPETARSGTCRTSTSPRTTRPAGTPACAPARRRSSWTTWAASRGASRWRTWWTSRARLLKREPDNRVRVRLGHIQRFAVRGEAQVGGVLAHLDVVPVDDLALQSRSWRSRPRRRSPRTGSRRGPGASRPRPPPSPSRRRRAFAPSAGSQRSP